VKMDMLFNEAIKAGILLNPGDIYDFKANNSIRLSYAYITKEEFDDYFEGKTVGFAYRIENLQQFEEPKELKMFGVDRGPQDYCYVEDR